MHAESGFRQIVVKFVFNYVKIFTLSFRYAWIWTRSLVNSIYIVIILMITVVTIIFVVVGDVRISENITAIFRTNELFTIVTTVVGSITLSATSISTTLFG